MKARPARAALVLQGVLGFTPGLHVPRTRFPHPRCRCGCATHRERGAMAYGSGSASRGGMGGGALPGRRDGAPQGRRTESHDAPAEPARPQKMHSLQDLNKYLDELLDIGERAAGDRRSSHHDSYAHLSRVATETEGSYQIVVLFGKHLVRDQITVEYASRIRRLVQCIKNNVVTPDLVCFTGGRSRNNLVADADAGYIFFRHMCEHQSIDVSNIDFFVESKSTCTREAMQNVIAEVRALQERRLANPSRAHHFTLISNEYHLSRIGDVHRLSPRRSLLGPVQDLGATWSYEYASYPYAFSPDEGVQFQSQLYTLLEELVPLLVNLQGLAAREEFFQNENYDSLTGVRRRLNDYISQLHSPRCPLNLRTTKLNLKELAATGHLDPALSGSPVLLDEALETAAAALSRVHDVVQPAALRRNSVSFHEWKEAAKLLERGILPAQWAVDPDRPLRAREWGVLVDDMPKVVNSRVRAPRARVRRSTIGILRQSGGCSAASGSDGPTPKNSLVLPAVPGLPYSALSQGMLAPLGGGPSTAGGRRGKKATPASASGGTGGSAKQKAAMREGEC